MRDQMPITQHLEQVRDYEVERHELLTKLDQAREALAFYADPSAWEWRPDPSGGWSGRVAVTDGGARARAALAQFGAVEV